MPSKHRLILASSSAYRRALLDRLGLSFESLSPDVDESALANERPDALSERLALAKAQAGAAMAGDTRHQTPTLIIGSDQVATLDGQACLGKPGIHARAVEQLKMSSGRAATFHTAVCLLCHDGQQTQIWIDRVDTRVRFRELSEATIEQYLQREQPYDCAGSAKSEGLGIALLTAIEGPDPTALIGLPLMALTTLLGKAGYPVL